MKTKCWTDNFPIVGHMVQKEAALRGQIEALKMDVGQLSLQLSFMQEAENHRSQELDRMTAENQQLLNSLRALQAEQEQKCQNCSCGKGKVTNV